MRESPGGAGSRAGGRRPGPFLAVLRDLVCATRELEPVAEPQSGERAIEAVREIEPDIVLLDVWMPGIGGIAAAREIKASRPSTLVIPISTTHPDEIPLEPDNIYADAVVWKERTRSTAPRRHLDAISRPARADALLASQPQREPVPVTPVVSGSDRTAPRDLRVTRPQGVPKAPTLLTGAPSCPTTTPMSDWPTDLRSARRSSPIPKEPA